MLSTSTTSAAVLPPTDHRNLDLTELNLQVMRGTSDGKILWQPRISCWFWDYYFLHQRMPPPFENMSPPDIYRSLGCSNRIYDFQGCFEQIEDSRVVKSKKQLSELETEEIIETPVGKITCINRRNTSNYGVFPKKWWLTCEEDFEVAGWLAERWTWKWNQEQFDKLSAEWKGLGVPCMNINPRTSIQHLFLEMMGVENGVLALYQYPETVERYFQIFSESRSRYIELINQSPIEFINLGDNIHAGLLTPEFFKKYLLPEYQRDNDLLHKAGKFTCSHWDGDTRPLLQFVKECGFDGIEAVTPEPQGDVTLAEVKKAFGDSMFLIDGIAAILFDDLFPIEQLERQVKELIDLFAPKLILGISDELPSVGNIDRVKYVGEIVDKYNASV